MTEADTSTRPNLIDATRSTRNTDLIRYWALVHGWNVAKAADPNGSLEFKAFRAGVEASLEYLHAHDRRTR